MKTIRKILSAVVALLPFVALGAAGDLKVSQKNSSDTAWIDRIFAKVNNGVVILDGSGVPMVLTPGTAGYMLTTNGSGSAPSWVAPATSGPLPSQTAKSGQVLTTDGSNASFSTTLGAVNSITAQTNTNLDLLGGGSAGSAILNGIFTIGPVGRIGPAATNWPGVSGTPQNASYVDHLVTNSIAGNNVMTIMSLSATGYSAIRFADSTGKEVVTVGTGNSGAGGFAGVGFIETSGATSNTTLIPIQIMQSYNDGSPHALVRMLFAANGTVSILDNASTTRFSLTSTGIATTGAFTNSSGAFTNTGTFSTATSGTAVIRNDLTITDAANTGGVVNLFDGNHSIYGREAAANQINYYEFGGTLASGKGHRFFTGGVKASQTLRFQIADDFVSSAMPVTITDATQGSSGGGALIVTGGASFAKKIFPAEIDSPLAIFGTIADAKTGLGAIEVAKIASGSQGPVLAFSNRATGNGSYAQIGFRGLTNASAERDYVRLIFNANDTTAGTGEIDFQTAQSGTVGNAMTLIGPNAVIAGTVQTASGSPFSITAVNVVAPTSPDRTFTFNYGGSTYYLAAKTTNN